MKKKILLTLLVVAVLTAAFAVSASAETVSHKCEACGQVVTWEPLNPKAGTLTAGTYLIAIVRDDKPFSSGDYIATLEITITE